VETLNALEDEIRLLVIGRQGEVGIRYASMWVVIWKGPTAPCTG
jgi:hypothetical protein